MSNTHTQQQKWIPGNNGGSPSNLIFPHTWNLNRTLLKNILTKLSILFMLYWREKIKTRKKILMIYFIFYLNCLNDKEKGLKLSIYKKYNFLYTWESGYPLILKRIYISIERGLKGKSRFSWHLVPWHDLQPNMRILKFFWES